MRYPYYTALLLALGVSFAACADNANDTQTPAQPISSPQGDEATPEAHRISLDAIQLEINPSFLQRMGELQVQELSPKSVRVHLKGKDAHTNIPAGEIRATVPCEATQKTMQVLHWPDPTAEGSQVQTALNCDSATQRVAFAITQTGTWGVLPAQLDADDETAPDAVVTPPITTPKLQTREIETDDETCTLIEDAEGNSVGRLCAPKTKDIADPWNPNSAWPKSPLPGQGYLSQGTPLDYCCPHPVLRTAIAIDAQGNTQPRQWIDYEQRCYRSYLSVNAAMPTCRDGSTATAPSPGMTGRAGD